MITITSEDFSCLHSHLDRTDKYNTWTIKYYAPNAKIVALDISADNWDNYFRVDSSHIDPLEINDHFAYSKKVIDQLMS
jgi:hypothetical protein